MNQPIRRICLTATAACGLLLSPASAQTTATTDPVGAMTVTLQPGADNLIGFPLKKPALSRLTVSSVSELSPDVWEVGFSGLTVTSGQFDQSYFIRLKDGLLDGYYFTILSNTSQTVTVDGLGVDLSALSVGDSFDVVEYHTLASLFPPSGQGSGGPLVLSSGDRLSQRGSQVLFPDLSGSGINRSSSETFYVKDVSNGGWARNSDRSQANSQVVLPDMYVVIRQPSDSGVRTLTLGGSVHYGKEAVFFHSLSLGSGPQDNYVALPRPVPTTLSELDFGSSFVESSGDRLSQRADQLLVFGTPSGLNPSASETFYKVNGEWRRNSDRSVADSYVLEAGSAFIVRKVPSTGGVTSVWTSSIQPGE